MRVGILGCGYVGSALALRCVELGHELFLTTTTPSKVEVLADYAQKVHILKVSQGAKLKKFIKDLDALFVTIAPLQGATYEETYPAAASALAKALRETPSSIKFIGYTSTTSVYGDHKGEWVDELSPLHAVSPNSKSLVYAEKIYRSLQTKDRQVTILRLGEIYGPGRDLESRASMMSGSTLPGKGASYVNMVHVEDIALALLFCLEHRIAGTFNLCNHTHITRKQLYSFICSSHHWPAPTWDNTKGVANFKQNKRVSSQKIESLGFRFQYPEALIISPLAFE